ncbi:MAG: NifU family protein [Planctomycetota bacterium]|jgi:Fe-S cluster biogenesis protein NfuA
MSESPEKTVKERVEEIIDRIRPMIQADGGDVDLVGVDDKGVVQVRLQGACASCPMSSMTLKMGIERNLKELVPEVSEVVALE